MNKKTWTDKLKGLRQLRETAKFNKNKAENDIEELTLMISAMKNKIKTFK